MNDEIVPSGTKAAIADTLDAIDRVTGTLFAISLAKGSARAKLNDLLVRDYHHLQSAGFILAELTGVQRRPMPARSAQPGSSK